MVFLLLGQMTVCTNLAGTPQDCAGQSTADNDMVMRLVPGGTFTGAWRILRKNDAKKMMKDIAS